MGKGKRKKESAGFERNSRSTETSRLETGGRSSLPEIQASDTADCAFFSEAHLKLTEEINRYLTEHMAERLTVAQLAARFHASATYIKCGFKAVYGIPVATYIRIRKMESAANMLERTDKSVLDIAMEHGYENGSKFAGAFRSVKGVSPREYRSLKRREASKNGLWENGCEVSEKTVWSGIPLVRCAKM